MARSNRRGTGRGQNSQRRKKSNSSTYIAIGAGVVALAIVIIFLCMPDNKHGIDEVVNVPVKEVRSGNTIVLQNGLTVELLGVKNTPQSKEFLQRELIGKAVTLKADSHDSKPWYKDPSNSTVKAYVTVSDGEEYSKLNGYILRKGMSDFNNSYCNDSTSNFKKYASNKQDDANKGGEVKGPAMDDVALGKYMNPRTFLIIGPTQDGQGGVCGTGFFINERGLAMTNYHVLSKLAWNYAQVYFSDEDGKIYADNGRSLGRPLAYDRKGDYAIFTVNLDNGEKVKYFPLAKKREPNGTRVGVIGNPSGSGRIWNATYTLGSITATRDEEGIIQTNADVTHGNSGGPMCNTNGEVLGIITAVTSDDRGNQNAANINLAIDIIPLREVLDGLKSDIAGDYGGKK